MKAVITQHSFSKDEKIACEELSCELNKNGESALSIAFFSHQYDLDNLSGHMREILGSNVIGCTTAGEITSEGYQVGGGIGISFSASDFVADTITIDLNDDLSSHGLDHRVRQIVSEHSKKKENGKTFAILLTDGLSAKEELLVEILAVMLGDIPLVGGSSGDGLNFKKTHVYCEGEFKERHAVVALLTTDIEFNVFMGHHFTETDKKFVITKAEPSTRTVLEIDGMPAAEFYAEALNIDLKDLSPDVYSLHPVMLKMGGNRYIRSIQKVNSDKSITFYCAIDEGIILYMAKRGDIQKSTEKLFSEVSQGLKSDGHVCLLFECILRRLEVEKLVAPEYTDFMNLYKKYNAVGFHTYGEQLDGVHVNQTLTGVIFGGQKRG